MIPDNFTDAFAQVKNLVQRFSASEKDYLSAEYQEANVRQEFLDKFFVALGWDVYHEQQTNPYQREVRIEKSIKVEGRGKRADYAFLVAPNFQQTRFIAEAKKPIHNLENRDYCFQALRYGWNSNTPLAILTDFDRLFILDSRYKPSIETAISRIHKRFRYTDFADEEKFREIYFLFSRQAVADDSIEKYVADFLKGAKKKGKQIVSTQVQPVDEVFLKELDEQREKLAKSFKNRNPNLDGEELTEITQRTLDRLVFIRFLEDKLVEANELINNFGAKSNSAWQDFTNESVRLNKIYNGIIFKPHSILVIRISRPMNVHLKKHAIGFRREIRLTILIRFRFTFSAAFTNAFSAKRLSPPTNAPESKKNPKSAKRAEFITRPNILSVTLSKTRLENF